jgi:hypothetical protein
MTERHEEVRELLTAEQAEVLARVTALTGSL